MLIAHGTTQATNALLEGDVAKVGVVTLGQGLQGAKSKGDTTIGNIELAPGKYLKSDNVYVDTAAADIDAAIRTALETLKKQDCTSFVAAEAFSVDDPARENRTVELCKDMGLPGTATNDISKLYGLKIRTRTAVVNASIMPKMLEAATMTDQSIKAAGIESPLMVMRCDGGVMTVDEVRNRPILTILSGPAAGVAGALMYEKLTDGLFFEVGGTSTDISCVKDGKVMIRYAEVGGHKTYLNSLDVRTVGIGGSMVEIKNGKAVDTGPRSAHIAGLDYEVYTPAEKIVEPKLASVRPMETDPEYACIECANGVRVALTMAGAANLAGYVHPEDYAYGNTEAARKAWQPLADNMGCTVEEAAKKVLAFAAAKNSKVAAQLMKDYEMDPKHTVFVGGGGGCAAFGGDHGPQVPDRQERACHLYNRCGPCHGAGYGGAQRYQSYGCGYYQRPQRGGAEGNSERCCPRNDRSKCRSGYPEKYYPGHCGRRYGNAQQGQNEAEAHGRSAAGNCRGKSGSRQSEAALCRKERFHVGGPI